MTETSHTSLETLTVTSAALTAAGGELLGSAGVPPPEAEFVAQTLVESDLRGHHSHGVVQIPGYLRLLDRKNVLPRGEIRVERRGPGHAVIDGGLVMGQLAANQGMRLAIELASEGAMGAVTVRRSAHYGAGGYWVKMAADAGMIGFSTSNEATVTVGAHGGLGPSLVNAPFAWAIPAGDESAIVIDMATGVAADGKLNLAKLLGQSMQPGWAVDGEGKATLDPREAAAILPFGGAKGYAINVLCDVLSGILSGSEASTVMVGKSPGEGGWANHFFMALNIQAFTELERFRQAVDRQIRALRSAKAAVGVERVRLPGERSADHRRRRLREGIPMARAVLARLAGEARERGIDAEWIGEWTEGPSQST